MIVRAAETSIPEKYKPSLIIMMIHCYHQADEEE